MKSTKQPTRSDDLLARSLEINHHPLSVTRVVRSLPGRRLVCQGSWNDRHVFAKIFFGKEDKRYFERDLQGSRLLAGAQIRTPELLFAGPDDHGLSHCLIFEAIASGTNAQQFWDMADAEQRLALMQDLVVEVARHHHAGLMQMDLYLNNFLYESGKLYTLDGDGIRRLPGMFKRNAELRNLALLLSKFGVLDLQQELPQLLAMYARERGWSNSLSISHMQKRILATRLRVVEKYADRKVFRECTDIQVKRTCFRFQAEARLYASRLLDQALAEPDHLLDADRFMRLKSGNTCTVALADIDDRKVVVKRYNIKSFWHGLSRALRQSRAAVSWSNAYRLKMLDIATAEPVALLERRYGLIRRQAYLLTEYVDAPDIHDFFADVGVTDTHKQAVAGNVARLFEKLNLLAISHGDFKATNVKIADSQPLLIDLDSMRQHTCRRIFERQHVRDLRRFLQNWQHQPQTKAMLTEAFRKFYKDSSLLQQAGWL